MISYHDQLLFSLRLSRLLWGFFLVFVTFSVASQFQCSSYTFHQMLLGCFTGAFCLLNIQHHSVTFQIPRLELITTCDRHFSLLQVFWCISGNSFSTLKNPFLYINININPRHKLTFTGVNKQYVRLLDLWITKVKDCQLRCCSA